MGALSDAPKQRLSGKKRRGYVGRFRLRPAFFIRLMIFRMLSLESWPGFLLGNLALPASVAWSLVASWRSDSFQFLPFSTQYSSQRASLASRVVRLGILRAFGR